MITKENFAKVLEYLGFIKLGNIYSKHYESSEDANASFDLKTNISTGEFFYPDGVEADRETTQDDHQKESYVVFACVAQLFALGYKPHHFKLEGKNYSGTDKGFVDILVRNNDGDEYLIIECKTESVDDEKEDEFRKHWKKTLHNGDQLFRYFNTYRKAKYLCLFACDWSNDKLENTYHVISLNDNEEYLKTNKKLRGFDDVRNEQGGQDEYFEVWKNTYKQDYSTRGIFEEGLEPFKIGTKKYSIDDLVEIDQSSMQKKYNRFAEILRQHNVSSKENAFDKLVNLFLSKIVDETENKQELKCLWKGTATDNFFDLQDRLHDLYRKGMKDFFGDTVTYVANEQIEDAFKFLNEQASFAKDKIKRLLFDLKYFNNNPFAFLDVHNEDLFYKNAAILIEVVKMLQDIKLKTETQNQFLGDLFEGFLDQGIKQSEGQFFTPLPIVRFLISSLPLQQIIQKSTPNVIDYACGAGHFLTEFASQIKPIIIEKHKAEIEKYSDEEQRKTFIADLMKKYNQCIFGIEKEYRLSKVSKVSAFMYGQDGVNIIYADALTHIDKVKNNTFDVLVANPPYSVKGFLETLTEDEQRSFELFGAVSDLSKNNAIETFFVERAKQLLKSGGVAAIILPVPILDKSGIYTKCREIILKHFDIIAIFESGSGTFGKTGTNTSTLFLRRRPCDKNGDTDIVEHYQNRVNTWFAGCFDNDTYYDDYPLFEQYCSRIEVDASDYKTLFCDSKKEEYDCNTDSHILMAAEPITEYGVKRTWREALSNYEIFESYIAEFENDGEAKKIKQQIEKTRKKLLKGKYTQEIKDMELADLNKKFEKHVFDSVVAIEKEKLLYFLLANSNKQKVIVVKSPDSTKEIQRFLGYKWSDAKGNEGIKYLNVNAKSEDDDTMQQLKGIDSIQTPLFNPKNMNDTEKINTLIKTNYINGFVSNIPESLKEYVSLLDLRDMLDFNKVKFEKDIKRFVLNKVIIESKYPLVNLGGENGVCDIRIGGTPSRNNMAYYTGNNLWVSIAEMNGQVITDTKEKITDEGVRDSNVKLIPKGTTLLSFKLSIGKTAIAGTDLYTNEAIAALIPKNKKQIMDEYIFALFNGRMIDLENVSNKAFGKSLNSAYLNDEVQIPLPPVDIQQLIVSECERIDEENNSVLVSIKEYKERIRDTFKELNKSATKNIRLSNKDYFDISIGQRVLSTEVNPNYDIPVYSANVFEPFGMINKLLIEDFSKESVIWGIDGDWMVNVISANQQFYPTDHCGVLRIKTEDILPQYMAFLLEEAGRKVGFKRSYRASMDRIESLSVQVASIEDQIVAVSRVRKFEEKIAEAKAIMASSAERKKEILRKYLE
ncbi:MAG: N-6 DNA methylase [Salinivirgaceae bacterium]|nr:N-6 DNA methylase [Salinivirgaceae bacterium]